MNESNTKGKLFRFEINQTSASIILLISLAGLITTPLVFYSVLRYVIYTFREFNGFNLDYFLRNWDFYLPHILILIGYGVLIALFTYSCIKLLLTFRIKSNDRTAPIIFVISLVGFAYYSTYIFLDIYIIFETIENWNRFYMLGAVEYFTYYLVDFSLKTCLTIFLIFMLIRSVQTIRR